MGVFMVLRLGQSLRTEECVDRGESFAGAWLGHVQHVIENPDIEKYEDGDIFRSKKRTPCEDASWSFFYSIGRRDGVSVPRKQSFGSWPHFSVDVLDYAVYHLSTLERLIKKDTSGRLPTGDVEAALDNYAQFYSKQNMAAVAALARVDHHDLRQTELRESTVVVVPVIIGRQAEGNSKVTYRKKYLDLMFWSIYPLLPRIVFVVKDAADREFLARYGYPVWDIMVLDDLGTDCALPLAAVVEARRCLKGLPCRSSHDWTQEGLELMYFTEGDQILAVRDVSVLLEWARLDIHRKTLVVPHRLVLLPQSFMAHIRKQVSPNSVLTHENIHSHTCCMDTGDRCMSRLHFKHVSDAATPVANIHGVNVVLGHANFWSQNYRTCNVSTPRMRCPDNYVFNHYNRNTSKEYFLS